jgi:hypothetical protein
VTADGATPGSSTKNAPPASATPLPSQRDSSVPYGLMQSEQCPVLSAYATPARLAGLQRQYRRDGRDGVPRPNLSGRVALVGGGARFVPAAVPLSRRQLLLHARGLPACKYILMGGHDGVARPHIAGRGSCGSAAPFLAAPLSHGEHDSCGSGHVRRGADGILCSFGGSTR